MRGGIVGDEEFIAWEPFSHMAFRFNESTSDAISAFAEDYRVVQTPGGCHLTWVMAIKPKGVAGRLGMTLGRPLMAWLFQRFLHNLRRYTDERYVTRTARSVETRPCLAPDGVGVGHRVVAASIE